MEVDKTTSPPDSRHATKFFRRDTDVIKALMHPNPHPLVYNKCKPCAEYGRIIIGVSLAFYFSLRHGDRPTHLLAKPTSMKKSWARIRRTSLLYLFVCLHLKAVDWSQCSGIRLVVGKLLERWGKKKKKIRVRFVIFLCVRRERREFVGWIPSLPIITDAVTRIGDISSCNNIHRLERGEEKKRKRTVCSDGQCVGCGVNKREND